MKKLVMLVSMLLTCIALVAPTVAPAHQVSAAVAQTMAADYGWQHCGGWFCLGVSTFGVSAVGDHSWAVTVRIRELYFYNQTHCQNILVTHYAISAISHRYSCA